MPIADAVREVFEQGRDDNPASWRWMFAFYDYVTSLPVWGERCLPLSRLVLQIADSPLAIEFRAGQSLHDLLISTKSENGLAFNDPYIRVSAEGEALTLDVEYWRGGEVGDLMESHTVTENEAMNVLEPLLVRLQSEASTADASEE